MADGVLLDWEGFETNSLDKSKARYINWLRGIQMRQVSEQVSVHSIEGNEQH